MRAPLFVLSTILSVSASTINPGATTQLAFPGIWDGNHIVAQKDDLEPGRDTYQHEFLCRIGPETKTQTQTQTHTDATTNPNAYTAPWTKAISYSETRTNKLGMES